MSKPLGVWQAYTDAPTPPWAWWRAILDGSNFEKAAEESRRTGLKWILLLYGCPRHELVAEHAKHVATRLSESGLREHLIGVCFWEEWFGALQQHTVDYPTLMHHIPKLRDWISLNLRSVKQALPGIPTVWVDSWVADDPSFGPAYWHPLPEGIDVLAVQAYVSRTGTWASDVEPFLDYTVSTQRDKTIILVPGLFRQAGMFDADPTQDTLDNLARWIARDEIDGVWLFDWESPGPGHGVTGAADFPKWREPVLKALGVAA